MLGFLNGQVVQDGYTVVGGKITRLPPTPTV
jgi:hypothetical protein